MFSSFVCLGKVLHPVSATGGTIYIRHVFQIKNHPDRPKTQMVWNYSDCQVEPTGGSHTGKNNGINIDKRKTLRLTDAISNYITDWKLKLEPGFTTGNETMEFRHPRCHFWSPISHSTSPISGIVGIYHALYVVVVIQCRRNSID